MMVMAMLFSSLVSVAAQQVKGKVVDENEQPISFVNVALLTLPDSTIVDGTLTDDAGQFSLTSKAPRSRATIVKLTCLGYEDAYAVCGADSLHIVMREDTYMLGEVVVKGNLPKTRVKGDAMRTTVAGTILEKAGTVSDALSKIPSLESERNGGVKVLGRGDAEVYINGRKVQDVNELSRLRSDQIEHVDVVQNPGARYAASTKAVVRITLKKAQGDGFSFQDYLSTMYQYGFTITNNLDLNYRTGGLDITASFWAGRFGHSKSLQTNDLIYFVGPDRYDSFMTQDSKQIWKGWSPQLQVNYMVNENHSLGAYYKFDRHPSGDYNGLMTTENYKNDTYIERSISRIWQGESFKKHIFNVYYNGKVGQLGIDLNIDGLFDKTTTPGNTNETTVPVVENKPVETDETIRSIESNTGSSNNFTAAKLILSYPVWQGNLSLGGEYSYNHRTDAYSFQATDAVPVTATDTEINERSFATFLEYGRHFGKVFAQIGLRYEHLSNDYYNFGVKEHEACRNYGDWFPTAVVSLPIGQGQLSISYRRDIERPNYGNLTSSTIYVNRYTYQSGNPYLRPTYTHSLVLNAAYKWANLTLNYGRIKDVVTLSTEPYPGSADPLVSLVRPVNSNEAYNRFNVQLSARPTIGCWHPSWMAMAQFQDFKSPTAEGGLMTLNCPLFVLSWQNDIELPRGFRLMATAQWTSKGDYDNFRITRSRFNTQVGLQRDFNLRALGTLTVDLRCVDLFNTSKAEATVYGLRELTTFNPARRTFMLDLTWKFNEARSKYRGSGAGEKQKARM